MTPVKVVFEEKISGSGPHSLEVKSRQGVAIELSATNSRLVDMATRDVIAIQESAGWDVGPAGSPLIYAKAFIHAVEPS